MKVIKFYAIIVVLAFLSTSCVENSVKYKSMVAQRDSLDRAKQALDSSYNQTLEILNDVETGFSNINKKASEMKVNLEGIEGKQVSKRELIAAQMTAVKDELDKNKAKIADLRRLNAINEKFGKANIVLEETIKRLQSEMDAKDLQIQALQEELSQKNIKIEELNTTVTNQSKNIADQQNVMEQQKTTIKGQDADMNKVWYCVANTKALKAAKVLSAGGLFQAKKVMDTEFDTKAFTEVDLRTVTSIPTNSKSIKIISFHPQSSYSLETGADKIITIKISNPTKFWSVSKYLVVQI
jgi:predicted  nucleic acid-binding Zn-ribbon protein